MPIMDFQYSTQGAKTLYDKFNRIDQAIYESEKEMLEDDESTDLDEAFEILNKKYFGQKC